MYSAIARRKILSLIHAIFVMCAAGQVSVVTVVLTVVENTNQGKILLEL